MLKKSLFLAFLFADAVGASAQLPAANLTRIGAAAAVKGLVNAMAPGQSVGRMVESGKPLYLNDHVTTDAAGHLQVLLLDQTVFTMGPNSDMVLDEFVYDPASDKGKVSARITKGVFRFVTGKVARKNPASMKVDLPVGTIGIRGTIAAGEVTDHGTTVILLGPGSRNNANENAGAISVYNAHGRVELTKPGFGTTLAWGMPPTTPANMSLQLRLILGALGIQPTKGTQASNSAPSGTPTGQASGSNSPKDPPSAGVLSGDQTSATNASGQATAQGVVLADTSGDILGFTNLANNTQTVAAQTQAGNAIADGISTWQQVNTAQVGMVGYYSGVGNYACSGGMCYSGMTAPSGLSFGLVVNFANATFGGTSGSNSSYVQLTNGPINDSTSITTTAFGAAGNAVITLNAANSTSSSFNNTTLTFQNQGGVAAQNVAVNLSYSNSELGNATGSATGAFTSAAGSRAKNPAR